MSCERDVPDVAIAFPSEEQDPIVAPERHDHSRRLIDIERLLRFQRPSIPYGELSIAHLAEPSRSDLLRFSHPQHSGAFDPTMSLTDPHSLTSRPRIKYTDLPISGSSGQKCPSRIERHRLNRISMSRKRRPRIFRIGQIP